MNLRRDYAVGLTAVTLLILLSACGGGGGSGAPDVAPGPPPANQPPPVDPVPPTQVPNNYVDAEVARATITEVRIGDSDEVDFSLVDDDGIALTGLTSANVRLHMAKLIPATDGNAAYWQSYFNRVKVPAVNPENPSAIQATSERGGELTDHGDGTYTYQFLADIEDVNEPLAVNFEPELTHRVGIQFSGGFPINPTYDWVPATGATSAIVTHDVAATDSCSTCHNPLAIHGGGRFEMKLCVTCHNPGTIEPNSGESMDMAVLTHRIHMGAQLPSVLAGEPYIVWGYRDSEHDYSDVVFPQNVANCAKCHAGSASADEPIVAAKLTSEGDNWHQVPTMTSCGSCHDDLDFGSHQGGQFDNSGCQSCHNPAGISGSIIDNHRNLAVALAGEVAINIEAVTNTAPGSRPIVQFSVTNPADADRPWDILNDPSWSRLRLALSWNTDDFTNTGVTSDGKPYSMITDALALATADGDGTYTLTAKDPLPDGSEHPFRAATGTGMAIFEGRREVQGERIPIRTSPSYFAIDDLTDSSLTIVERRKVVSAEQCDACHGLTRFHGDLRTNTEAGCQGCHNPRTATDAGESLDMKRMIHGIHAAAVRTEPLTLRGDPFDTEVVQFPGELKDCRTCHAAGSYLLPVSDVLLGVTTDMGADLADPADDVMMTPQAATCTGCHDSELAKAHMTQNGADFTASEATIGVSTETCEICHGAGRTSDVMIVHDLQ